MNYSIKITHLSKIFYRRTPVKLSLLEQLAKKKSRQTSYFQVLDDISLECRDGEIIGISGKNGSGKTTLLSIIAGIYPPTKGSVNTKGKLVSLLSVKLGSKDRLTVVDTISLYSTLCNVSKPNIAYQDILDFAGLTDQQNNFLYQLSQGMQQRLILSIALHTSAKILLLDEVLEVSDTAFQKKAIKRLKQMAQKDNCTILIASHNSHILKRLCSKILVLDKGKLVNIVAVK